MLTKIVITIKIQIFLKESQASTLMNKNNNNKETMILSDKCVKEARATLISSLMKVSAQARFIN